MNIPYWCNGFTCLGGALLCYLLLVWLNNYGAAQIEKAKKDKHG